MNKNNGEESDNKTWFQQKYEPALEKLKQNIRIEGENIVENIRTNIEELIDSRVPFVTANIREELEKLIDHKIESLKAPLNKIAIIIFVCTLPLTLGIWFLAFVLFTK